MQTNNIILTSRTAENLPLQELAPSSYTSQVYKATEKVWSYVGKSLLISRHTLNAAVRSCFWVSSLTPGTIGNIHRAIVHTKLFAFVALPFNAFSISLQTEKLSKNFERNDWEGICLGSLSLLTLLGDSIDSFATFFNAALETFSSTSNQLLASIGLPLGFSLISLGTISRAVRIYHIKEFLKALKKEPFMQRRFSPANPQEIRKSLTRFLNHLKLDVSNNQLLLERHISAGPANLFKELHQSLSSVDALDNQQIAKTLRIFQQIHKHLSEEIAVQKAYASTNILIFSALILFVCSVPSPLPYLMLAMSWGIRLMLQTYQDFIQDRLPEHISLNKTI